MRALSRTLLVLSALAMSLACGSSYNPKYTIPASNELQKFEPPADEDILDEAGLLDEDEDEGEGDEPAKPDDGGETEASQPGGEGA